MSEQNQKYDPETILPEESNRFDKLEETLSTGQARHIVMLERAAKVTIKNTVETPKLYPSEQRRRDRAITTELLTMANEYPIGRVAYLCLPENRQEALRLGLIRPEDLE